jgi:hypothetical protein
LTPEPTIPRVTVKRFVDYSKKYGVAFVLSTGQVGVRFNDNTQVMNTSKSGSAFVFSETLEFTDGSSKIEATTYQSTSYPARLKDKVFLLQKFDAFLHTEGSKFRQSSLELPSQPAGTAQLTGCQKIAEGMVFRFEGGQTHSLFKDGTELHLRGDKVTFFSLDSATQSVQRNEITDEGLL